MAVQLPEILSFINDIGANDLQIDSRNIQPGNLFLALSGDQFDGAHFIKNALAQGAVGALYEAVEGEAISSDSRVLAVKNLAQLQASIAAHFYQQPSLHLDVVGVTGTNGKTSIAHFLAQAWHYLDQSCAVMGTLGNGVFPQFIKAMPNTTVNVVSIHRQMAGFVQAKVQHVAMEVSSHAIHKGRIDEVALNTAVFTNLSQDHLDYHHDMSSYANIKMQLFKQPGLQNAVVNLDDPIGQRIADANPHLTQMGYSLQQPKNTTLDCVYAQNIQLLADGLGFDLYTPWGQHRVQTSLLGRFNVSNLLAVASVMGLASIPFEKIVDSLQSVCPIKGRMQKLGQAGQPTVIVDFAHTPDALEKVLQTARESCVGKLWCVFGCGGNRDRGKRSLMATVAEYYADRVIVTHDNPRFEDLNQIIADIEKGFINRNEHVMILPDRAQAIAAAVHSAEINDIVLIAGKGHENTQIVGDQAHWFSDIEQAQLQLASYCND